MAELTGYTKMISEAVSGLTPAQYDEVELIMREDVFHSTLDWQTPLQFRTGAIAAYAIYRNRVAADAAIASFVPDIEGTLLLNDQPVTCPLDGSRTEWLETSSGTQYHTCLLHGHKFLAEEN